MPRPLTLPVSPVTAVGVDLCSNVLSLPSWPLELSPQQRTVPSARRAQVWAGPAARATALAKPLTGTGVERGVAVPSPSWPLALLPQQRTVASAVRVQVWEPPAARATAFVSPLTWTGASPS